MPPERQILGKNAGEDLIKKKTQQQTHHNFAKIRERAKRIWQNFLLTNYCNFPRQIFWEQVANTKLGNALIFSLPHPAARSSVEVGGEPSCASTSALAPSSPRAPRALIPFFLGKNSILS